jgi:hypothetical protein
VTTSTWNNNGVIELVDQDPYSYWILCNSRSINAFNASLGITCLMMFHQSSVSFNGPDNEYSEELRRAWWKFARIPQTINIFLMMYALYFSTESYVMIMWMMLPNLEGSRCSSSSSVMNAMFDFSWENKHKYNFSCNMIWSMGWFFVFFGVVCTIIFFSSALAYKHHVYQKLLKVYLEDIKNFNPKSNQVVPQPKQQQPANVETILRELVEQQGELQRRILDLVATMATTSEENI